MRWPSQGISHAAGGLLIVLFSLTLFADPFGGKATKENERVTSVELNRAIARLRPLHQRMAPPGPMDWLAGQDEKGQTFRQYIGSSPVTPRGTRQALYIQPIGSFSDSQQEIVDLTADYMERYFNLEVRILPVVSSSARMCRPSVGWLSPSARAAAESEPVSATARKARMWVQSRELGRLSIRK